MRRRAALAEQLERSRDQVVERVDVEVRDGRAVLTLHAGADLPLAQWAAQRQADVFEAAYGLRLDVAISAEGAQRPAAGAPS